MTVQELIETLKKLPPTDDVMIAFDMGIRLRVEVAKPCVHKSGHIVVITDKDEWEDREYWS